MLELAQKEVNDVMGRCIEISDSETSQVYDFETVGNCYTSFLVNSHNAKDNNDVTCNYSRTKAKEQRNKGGAYINSSGAFVPAKQFRPLSLDCRRKCKTKVPHAVQRNYYDTYWSLGAYNRRIMFIGALMEIVDKKSYTLIRHTEKPRERRYNIKYILEVKGVPVQVCQKCFRQCFDESEGFVKYVQKKLFDHSTQDFRDLRGLSSKVLTTNVTATIKEHIEGFPHYEIKYSDTDDSCKVFPANLTVDEMYRLFCEQYKAKAVTFADYNHIFNTMNIKFLQDHEES